MNRLTALQRRANADSAAHWRLSAEHRGRVMQLIRQSAPAAGGRVCVLGAGNCNDLDLPQLLEIYGEAVLIDLDGDALRRGAERQGVAKSDRIRICGDRDITGVWDDLHQVAENRHGDELLDRLIRRAAAPPADDFAGPYETVVSACVLSQIINSVIEAIGVEHPRFLEVLQAVRLGHLRLLADLAAPQGAILLVTDFVSSDSAPEILAAPDVELKALAQRLLASRNFFHGLHPGVVASLWTSDPRLAAAIGEVQVLPPWRWRFGVRDYLTTAYQVRRTSAAG